MYHHHTHSSRDAVPLPTSGVLVGRAAKHLRLKGVLRDGGTEVSYKSAQRYFRGERIDEEAVREILGAMIGVAIPPIPPDLLPDDSDVQTRATIHELLVQSGVDMVRAWDRFVARSSLFPLPAEHPSHIAIALLRLVTLDAGVRWGSWQALRQLQGLNPDFDPEWLYEDALRRAMDELRGDMTVENLTRACGVSANTMSSWRSGSSLPRDKHLQTLARALAAEPQDMPTVEARLRLVCGLRGVLSGLERLISQDRLADFIAGFRLTAKEVTQALERGVPPEALLQLLMHGAHAPGGDAVCRALEHAARFHQEVAADFAVLPRDWTKVSVRRTHAA